MAETCLWEEGLKAFKESVASRIHDIKEQQDLDGFLRASSSPDEALKLSNDIKGEASKKYGGIKVDGKTIDDKWVRKIMDNVQNFIAVGDFVMKKAPESVGAAWFGVSLCLSAIQNNYALYSLFGTGLMDITELMVTIKHYDYLYYTSRKRGIKESENSARLFKDMTETYSAMLDFAFSVQRHLSGSGWAKLRHGFKDFFKANEDKFRAKTDRMSAQKQKVLERSQGAFQEVTFQQFDDVQHTLQLVNVNVQQIKDFQKDSEELQKQQLEMQQEWTKAWEEVKDFMKPRTPWENAMQRFNAIKKLLTPLEKTADPLFDALDAKFEGTCKWLSEHPSYDSWYQSGTSNMICVTGQRGVGKSTLLASTFVSIDNNLVDDTCVALFLSCGMPSSGGQIGDDSPRSFNRVSNTLIYQLYSIATRDESKPALLERCNDAFANPKKRRPAKASKEIASGQDKTNRDRRQDDSLPGLAEVVPKLCAELEKKLVIVLDEIDRMPSADQVSLFEALQEMITRGDTDSDKDVHVRILTACQSEGPFANQENQAMLIDMEAYNRVDIQLQLSHELGGMSTWTEDQKQEAVRAVMDKASSKFDYVSQIAIPFLKEPFQGPLSDRLKELPDGIGETYAQALRAMAPNYCDPLRTALSFTLFSPGPAKVVEVLDTFTGVYLQPLQTEETLAMSDDNDSDWDRQASEIEIQQLREAAGPFLNVWKNDSGEFVTELKDIQQVQRFFLHNEAADDNHSETPDSDALCQVCRLKRHSMKHFSFSEKDGHLDLALTCVRHMCNRALWERCYGWRQYEEESNEVKKQEDVRNVALKIDHSDPKEDADEDADAEQPVAQPSSKIPFISPPCAQIISAPISAEGMANGEDEADTQSGANVVQLLVSEQVGATNGLSGASEDQGYDSDESMDDEDRGDFYFKTSPTSDQQDTVDQQSDRFLRYEMRYWYHHIQQAEALWTEEERSQSPKWQELMRLLDMFAFEQPQNFARCQALVFALEDIDAHLGPARERGIWKPLNLASLLGLASWAKHLVERGESVTEECNDRNPLQAAAKGTCSNEVLKILLEHGADPNYGTEKRMPAAHSWLITQPTSEGVELLIRYGADFSKIDLYNKWSSLHYFASGESESPEVLKLLLGVDVARRPDINAIDEENHETPLHVLLHRRNVPEELLQAFIESGANINAEDDESERPLQEACKWGDEKIVKMLLPRVKDIDDGDRHERTALHQASWDASIGCVRLLLDETLTAPADPTKVDKHGRTPLFFACLGGSTESEDTAKLLLKTLQQRSVPVTEICRPTMRGRTPLRQAAAHGYNEILAELLQLIGEAEGVDLHELVNKADHLKGKTALHCAASRGHTECVRLLLKQQADPRLRDKNGQTALELSYSQWNLSGQEDYEDIIDLLIEADNEAAISDTELASSAAINGSVRLLRKLHSVDAKLDRVDRYGWTPLLLARRFLNTDAEDFLNKTFLRLKDKIPFRWVNAPNGAVLSSDGLGLLCRMGMGPSCVCTDMPLLPELNKFYFEVTSKRLEGVEQNEYPAMAIGFCTVGAAAIDFPGWVPSARAPFARSWGYHGDDGGFASTGQFLPDESRRYQPGDTIGCGVDFTSSTIWYTKNGKRVEKFPFADVRGRLFPVIGLLDAVDLETNFGSQPFVWSEENTNGVNGEK